MINLQSKLAEHLASTYRVDKELGGGGMSRTYLAYEHVLDRQVVVKVLAPELLANVSVERFRREVLLAAKLQHPHIVPVLSSGEIEGLPWFSMPYVDGDSLRHSLTNGPLGIYETVSVLRDVARALAYAHGHGVVHRDIKPDNVLLSSGTATVTDFGIAKAIDAARTIPGATQSALTQAGTSMGTPAYMSPEQAVGDASADHRVDIYAFGVMAYEMLAGDTPFRGETAHRLISAHLMETPRDIATIRTDCPAPLAELVMRCLAKEPSDRPQSANEVVEKLESVATDVVSGSSSKPSDVRTGGKDVRAGKRKSRKTYAMIAALLLVGASILGMREFSIGPFAGLRSTGEFGEHERLVVADFVSPSTDTLLGVSLAEALRTDLAQSKSLDVPSRSKLFELIRQLRGTDSVSLDFVTARELATREGIKAVLAGDVTQVGNRYLVSARLVNSISGAELLTFREEAGSENDLLPAMGKLARSIRRKAGEPLRSIRNTNALERVTTSSMPALRKYMEGSRIYSDEGDADRAAVLLHEAVELDPGFAMAWRRLAAVMRSQGVSRESEFHAIEMAFQHRDRLTELERLMTEGSYYLIGRSPDRARAAAAYNQILRVDSLNPVALNAMGLIESIAERYEIAEQYYRRAIVSSSFSGTSYGNLIQAMIVSNRSRESIDSVIDEFRGKFPDNTQIWKYYAMSAYAAGDYEYADSLARVVYENARSGYDKREASAMLDDIATLHGKYGEGLKWRTRYRHAVEASTSPHVHKLVTSIDTIATGLYRGEASELTRRKVSQALKRYPMDSVPGVERPYLDLMVLALITEDIELMQSSVNGFLSHQVEVAYDSTGARMFGDAMLQLVRGEWDNAIANFEGARERAEGLTDISDIVVGMAHDRAGRPDSAAKHFETFLNYRNTSLFWRANFEVRLRQRLADMYEQKGEVGKAEQQLAEIVELWRNADAEVQGELGEMRQRLERIRARTR